MPLSGTKLIPSHANSSLVSVHTESRFIASDSDSALVQRLESLLFRFRKAPYFDDPFRHSFSLRYDVPVRDLDRASFDLLAQFGLGMKHTFTPCVEDRQSFARDPTNK